MSGPEAWGRIYAPLFLLWWQRVTSVSVWDTHRTGTQYAHLVHGRHAREGEAKEEVRAHLEREPALVLVLERNRLSGSVSRPGDASGLQEERTSYSWCAKRAGCAWLMRRAAWRRAGRERASIDMMMDVGEERRCSRAQALSMSAPPIRYLPTT